MQRILFLSLFMICMSLSLRGQSTIPNYELNVRLDTANDRLYVKQNITFKNTEDTALNQLILNDWAHAYSSTKSALADRLVEEYNRSFYLAQKTKRGKTSIKTIASNNSILQWKRTNNQFDIIEIDLVQPLNKNEVITLNLEYTIDLPDGRFTGYGAIAKETYLIENFFLSLAKRSEGKWQKISNLDLEDAPMGSRNIAFTLIIPSKLAVHSSIEEQKRIEGNQLTTYLFTAKEQKQVLFHIGKDIVYKHFELKDKKFKTNIDLDDLSETERRASLSKINDFLKDALGEYPHNVVLLSQEKYNKRPFYGLTLIPSILKPFPAQFEFELKALNTYLYDYLSETLPLHSRNDYWLFGGLQTYLMAQYVAVHYPDKKLLESFMRQPLIQFFAGRYRFSNLSFEETFIEFYEYILRKNAHQELFRSKAELTRFNEQIGQPSHMGKILGYLVENNSADLSAFIHQIRQDQLTGAALKASFFDHFNINKGTGFQDYFSSRKSVDLSFSKLSRLDTLVTFQIEEKNDYSIPYSIGWVRNDSLIKTEYFGPKSIGTNIRRSNEKADYLVINPVNKLPEFNPRDNVKRLKSFGIKPIRFTFLKDLENPKYNQLFYKPGISFNVYDGISYGIRLNNKTVKRRTFIFSVDPLYSTKNKQLIGFFSTSYNKFNQTSNYYLKNIGFSGASFHYDENLRYSLLSASASIVKRPTNLRDNRREILRFYWQYVNREQNTDQIQNPNYTVGGLNYIISNKNALDYFTMVNNFEVGSKFGKISVRADYRHLTNSGRQFSLRLFAGKFLWQNDLNSDYFDFSLNRPTDYLFQYNYLGRSETSGIYSQQYIPAEGGFKTKIDNPLSNDYLITANTSMGIWKWVEAYGDIGFIKQDGQSSRILFDSGIRLNLLPDYLEFYFPIYNSNGLEFNQTGYEQKIRFVLTLDPYTLTQLFSRKWF